MILGRPDGEPKGSGNSPFEKGDKGLKAFYFEDIVLSSISEPAAFEKVGDGCLRVQEIRPRLYASFREIASMDGTMIDLDLAREVIGLSVD